MSLAYYIQASLTLIIFIAILYGALRIAKQFQQKKFSCEMKIIDRLILDSGIILYIVDVRGKQMLFSVSGKEMRLIKEQV